MSWTTSGFARSGPQISAEAGRALVELAATNPARTRRLLRDAPYAGNLT
ncbi:hypothetical protein ACFWPP_14485 [Streptomyces anulatus]